MKSIQNIFIGRLSTDNIWVHIGLLCLRLYAGITIAKAGIDKLPLPAWMTEQVESMNFPFPEAFAFLASFSEYAFGLALAIGLFTRLSAIMVFIVMGVAAFAFQKVAPFIDMHIAQHYVWSCMLLAATGGGKFSIDYLVHHKGLLNKRRLFQLALPLFLGIVAFGLVRQFTGEVNQGNAVDEDQAFESINIAGTFNNWDPTANKLSNHGDEMYSLVQLFKETGLIEFKFTTDQTWDVNFGEEADKTLTIPAEGTAEHGAENIVVEIAEPGIYLFTVNAETFSFTVTKYK